jgi:hypothetical protein
MRTCLHHRTSLHHMDQRQKTIRMSKMRRLTYTCKQRTIFAQPQYIIERTPTTDKTQPNVAFADPQLYITTLYLNLSIMW